MNIQEKPVDQESKIEDVQIDPTEQRINALLNETERLNHLVKCYEKSESFNQSELARLTEINENLNATIDTLKSDLNVVWKSESKYLTRMMRAEQALHWLCEKRESTKFLEIERECWELSNSIIEKSLEEFELLHDFDWKKGNPYKLTTTLLANFMNRAAYYAKDPREVLRETARRLTAADYRFLKEFGAELVFVNYPEKVSFA